MEDIKELTKAELQIMLVIWFRDKAFIHEIIAEIPEPKPAYTTVSTFTKILVKKGFLAFNKFGKNYQFYAIIDKKTYINFYLKKCLDTFFDGSIKKLIEFYISNEGVENNDALDIIDIIENNR